MIRVVLCVVAAGLLGGCACMQCEEHAHDGARALAPGAVIHYVRIRSGLPDGEAQRVLRERAERFRAVPGLVQKVYGRDAETGELCGVYIFESQAALEAFRGSDLARTLPEAYQVESARIERYDVLFTLWPGVRGE